MAYSSSTFLGTNAGTDKAVQIRDTSLAVAFTLHVCNYQKAYVVQNVLKIILEDATMEYNLNFTDKAEASAALVLLKARIENLKPNCGDSSSTVITTLTATSITYAQYKTLRDTSALTELSWYDISDADDDLGLGSTTYRVFCKTVNDSYPEGMDLNTSALVIIDSTQDFLQKFELPNKRILATNGSKITYDVDSGFLEAENASIINATNSTNIYANNSSVQIADSINVDVLGHSIISIDNATDVTINNLQQDLTSGTLGFNLQDVDIDTNVSIGKSGKTTTNVTTDSTITIQSYSDTIEEIYLFQANSKTVNLTIDNKITNANADFKIKLLLDSGISNCKVIISDVASNVLYTITDIYNDSWILFTYNKTTQLFEFVRLENVTPTLHHNYAFTPSNGQVTITLPVPPTDASKLEMFVNGVKMRFGTQFTFSSPVTVTYLEIEFPLSTSDTVEFVIY